MAQATGSRELTTPAGRFVVIAGATYRVLGRRPKANLAAHLAKRMHAKWTQSGKGYAVIEPAATSGEIEV